MTVIPPLDHGAIGNGRVLALIAPSTRIEWLCMPRFDSPSVFGAILDAHRGGSFGIELCAAGVSRRMEYLQNTNVLRTTLTGETAAIDIYDFAPRIPDGLSVQAPHEIHRLLVPRAGSPRVQIYFDPRPDYARAQVELVHAGSTVEVLGGPARFYLHTDLPLPFVLNHHPIHIDGPRYLVFSCGRPSTIDSTASVQRSLDLTVAGWRAWAKSCALPSFAADAVLRSALCLKLHQYLDTGAIIAAATTSIPEAPNGERTWDYRFCWLRDAAFTVEALRRLGQLGEGEEFARFLVHVAEGGPLQPVYGICGERELHEIQLDHLEGFAGGKPVRIGNAAYLQRQTDLMGEIVLVLETLLTDPRIVQDRPAELMRMVERMAEEAIAAAPLEDTGIWEYRTKLDHYTFSKAMCWVAVHRGAMLAARAGRSDLADRWGRFASDLGADILERGYNPELGYFTQALGGRWPDASNLLLPVLGIIDPRDPRFVSTMRAYEDKLTENGLILRYRHPDDFGATTTAFSICSFWMVEVLAMMGELDRATALFRRLLTHANPVGLFSEDIDPRSGRLLGNFPQAYTHVGLINAAVTLGAHRESPHARFRAWT
jgi:GH15 family glucan-1,4-alpha-glucosidase